MDLFAGLLGGCWGVDGDDMVDYFFGCFEVYDMCFFSYFINIYIIIEE